MPTARIAPSPRHCSIVALAVAMLWHGSVRLSNAADVAEASELFSSGQFAACAAMAEEAIAGGEYSETWRLLKIRSEMAIGRYPEAQATLDRALQKFRTSVRLRWLGDRVYRFNGEIERADDVLLEIATLTRENSWRYSDPLSRVTLGRYFLARGADPKQVLDAIYNEVKDRTRSFSEPYVAAGDLALAKHDYALAAEEFEAALRLDARNADVHFGLAQSYRPSDPEKADSHLNLALERNPQHLDSLLFVADGQLDAEQYEEVKKLLDRVASFHICEPRTWAYRAVLAHLENDPTSEEICRRMALAWWNSNPEVDSLIGAKLSHKYRFREGAAYQRRSLAFDPDYLPAKIALSQDLLRLGEEQAGWELANEVYDADGYNVVAHNLVTLHDNLAGYETLSDRDFVVRMEPREAAIYGSRVMDLLRRAKETLCEKYDVQLDAPILVEIFHRQEDFAIRTFGLPGGAGFLGVCFGGVITANSPASQGDHPSNWESVLWHEFCHVVTLNKTRNKMPRWLSEGISVYEEMQANSAWGQSMTPQYREMILGDDLTPVSQLSGAFLQPASPLHLQFAYFESAMVIEFLVERYGIQTLQSLLVDLGVGMPINESLQRYVGSLSELDQEFADYARDRARALAPELSWDRPEFAAGISAGGVRRWNEMNPDNYWGLLAWANQLIEAKQWEAAKAPLEQLKNAFPQDASGGSAYALLARVHRELGETDAELEVLNQLASRSADATDAYLRLMELAAAAEDWKTVLENAQRMLAVNPLVRPPHRFLTQAAEAFDDDDSAAAGLQVLALMDPHDPADIHYRLAVRLHRLGRLGEAKRQVLMSLEAAPRFRLAQQKLLELIHAMEQNEGGTELSPPTAAILEGDT